MIKSAGIIKIILFSSIGFLLIPFIIKINIIQYSSLPEKVNVTVLDSRLNQQVIFSLPVKSKLKIDSASRIPLPDSNIILTDILFHENPAFFVWMVLITVMMTIASGAFPVFLTQRQVLIKKFSLTKGQSRMASFSFLGVSVLLLASNAYLPGYLKPPTIIDKFHILLTHGFFLKGIETSTILLMAPVIIVMFLIGAAAGNIKITVPDEAISESAARAGMLRQNIQAGIDDFNYLNQTLRSSLQILAVVVVFSVLDSGALGRSVNSTILIKGMDVYPAEICYVYGMFFSLFLAIIYLPVFQHIKNRYAELNRLISKIGCDENIRDEKWMQDLSASLKFDGSGLDDLKVALTVLAPLITAFLPDYLHLLK